MKRAVHDGVAAAAIVFCIAYALPWLIELPQVWYQPLLRAWSFGSRPEGLVMDWYGRTSNALVFGAIAGAIGYALGRKRSTAPGPIWGWSIAAVLVVVMAIYVQHLAVRVPVPEPLPSWYSPR